VRGVDSLTVLLIHRLVILLAFGACAAGPLCAQCPDGTPPPCARVTAAPARPPDPHGVAVLYFGNLSRDTADGAIADGLTEEIIARLSQVRGLHVASRYASFRYRGRRAVDPRLVGRELGQRYVLDGTVRRSGQRLRVVLVMTDAAAGFNVWGQTYERPIDDIFSVQDSVAINVAEAVLGRLTSGERERLAPAAASASVDAYQAYLRGRVAIRARTAAAASAAVAEYRRAIALDPRLSRAWAGLAHALSLARDWGWSLRDVAQDSIQSLAARAAAQALALDSASADAWLAAAMAERAHDIRRALVFHQRAVALDSGSVEALHQLAWGYLGNGALDSGIAIERRVIARDPYYAYAYAGLANMLNVAGRPAAALTAATEGLVVDSTNAPLHWQMADALVQLGRAAEATRAAERAAAFGFDPLGARILRALARLEAGDTASVRAELPDLERAVQSDVQRSRGGLAYTTAALFSGLHARLGDADAAVRWARYVAEWPRRFYAVMFARHWMWNPVRDDPRFQAFLASLQS
jgi:TolB-like protein